MKNRNSWIVGAFTLLMFMGLWAIAGLMTRNHQATMSKVDSVLDEVDRDMGTYDSLKSNSEPTILRMKRMAAINRRKALEHRQMLDSLVRVANEGMGVGYEDPENDYNTPTNEPDEIIVAER